MASRTQLRLAQLTGSLDDTKAAAASISETSIQGVLDHLAASIKRIHGGSVFQNQAAGAFSQTINVTGAVTASAGVNVGGDLNVTTSAQVGTDILIGDDAFFNSDGAIINFGADDDVSLTHVADTGLLLNSTMQIQFGDAGENISGDGTDLSINSSNNITTVATNNITFDAQGTDPGDGFKVTLGTDTDVTVFKVVNNSDQDIITVKGNKDADFTGNVTITGDLTVNGSQTVLDTTSLVIEDSVIALASGSAADADVNSALVFQRATANLGGGSDMQNGALMFLQGTGFKLGYTNDNAETAQGSLAIANDDLATVWVNQLNLAGNTEYIQNDSGKIVAVSGGDIELQATTDIILDANGADIFLKDGGTEFAKLTYIAAQNISALSSSINNDLGLDANTGNILFAKDGASQSSPSTAAVNVATTNEIKFGHYDAPNSAFNVGFLTLKNNAVSVLSASSGLQIDSGENSAQLQLRSNDAEVLTLTVPDSLGTGFTLTLPEDGGTNGYVLQTNGSGVTSWVAQSSATYTKGGAVLTAGVTAGANLDLSGLSNVKGTFASNLDTAAFGEVDLYVNGSLMLSGSAADVSGGNVDYRFNGSQTAVFTFDLEIDDTVQVFKRA